MQNDEIFAVAKVVSDGAPDLTGGDEVFRTWRALRFATAFGPLLADHPATSARTSPGTSSAARN